MNRISRGTVIEEECVSYFRQCPVWNKILRGFQEKYVSYGSFGGKVVLHTFGAGEVEELEGFFGKNFHGQKSISISASGFEKALEKSRFKGISPKRILELYFGEELCSKKEQKEKEEAVRLEILQEIQVFYKDTPASGYINVLDEILKSSRNKGLEEWKRLLHLGAGIINGFPYRRQEFLYLSVFAARVTGNPHAFDQGTFEGSFLKLLIRENLKRRGNLLQEDGMGEIFPAFTRQKEYLKAGILLDDISNYTMLFGVRGWKKDGRLHAGLEGFFQEKEIVQLPLAVAAGLESLKCADDRIYIVENPSVFAMLTADNSREISCMCMNGQPRLSSLMVLKLLEKEKITVYYGGDLDPEGLLIAQKLKSFYQGEFHYWHMGIKDYEICRSREKISDRRLQILEKITDEELVPAAKAIQKEKTAGYQELLEFL